MIVVNHIGGETVADTAYTIRPFPGDLHRKAKATAALEGITLRELILKAVREYVEKKER
jgi:predicted HicB family RNase H-like nuclease